MDMKNGPQRGVDYNCDGTTDPYKLIVAQRKFQGVDARKAFMDDCIATPDQGHLFAQQKMQRYADVCQQAGRTAEQVVCPRLGLRRRGCVL